MEAANSESKPRMVQPQIQEAFSYSWYPTQCQIGEERLRESNSSQVGRGEAFRVFKSDENGEEMIVVEQATPGQTSPTLGLGDPAKLMGSKFSEQQSRALLATWKQLYDKKNFTPTNEADWREITNRVNMAPGSYKTLKQVKKKFKNLKDRYRAAKVKSKRKGIVCNKIKTFYAELEQIYGDEDYEPKHRVSQPDIEPTMKSRQKTGVSSATSNSIAPETYPQISKQKTTTADSVISFAANSSIATEINKSIPANTHKGSNIIANGPKIATSNENGFGASGPYSAPRISSNEEPKSQSQLIEAVRELQQQQITMQREITRNMKQMEERILVEVSSKIKESEDRFRQQIANALTQLGNLIRIT